MIPPVEFRQLRYVVAVGEHLHFTRAAERLHVTQSALTRQIAQLEQDLGVMLFKRDTRHVELTAAGEVFVEEAKRILESTHRAVALAQGAQRRDHGEIRIAYSPLVDLQVAGEIKRCLASSNPTLRLTISGATTPQQISGILDGTYLMGLMVLPVSDAALCTQVLVRQQIVAILPAGHRLTRRRQIGLLDLDGDPVVWIPQTLHPAFHAHIAEWWRGAGYHPTVEQEAEGLAERLQFVANGEGISFAAESVRRLHHPGVAFRIIVEPEFFIETGLVYRCDSKSVVLQQVLKSTVQHFVPGDVITDPEVPDDGAAATGTQTNH